MCYYCLYIKYNNNLFYIKLYYEYNIQSLNDINNIHFDKHTLYFKIF